MIFSIEYNTPASVSSEPDIPENPYGSPIAIQQAVEPNVHLLTFDGNRMTLWYAMPQSIQYPDQEIVCPFICIDHP